MKRRNQRYLPEVTATMKKGDIELVNVFNGNVTAEAVRVRRSEKFHIRGIMSKI